MILSLNRADSGDVRIFSNLITVHLALFGRFAIGSEPIAPCRDTPRFPSLKARFFQVSEKWTALFNRRLHEEGLLRSGGEGKNIPMKLSMRKNMDLPHFRPLAIVLYPIRDRFPGLEDAGSVL